MEGLFTIRGVRRQVQGRNGMKVPGRVRIWDLGKYTEQEGYLGLSLSQWRGSVPCMAAEFRLGGRCGNAWPAPEIVMGHAGTTNVSSGGDLDPLRLPLIMAGQPSPLSQR